MSVVVHQLARPAGRPTAEQFAYVTVPTPEPGSGQALVENLYLSVDPYMREVMDEGDLHAPMEGRSIGRVVESRDPALAAGDLVFHRQGWRSHALVTPDEVRVLREVPGIPLSAYLSVLGGTGLSAYVGLTRIARLQPGETVFISAAAGGVGNAAGQLAKLLGAGRVIGSTSSAAKARRLVETVGFDAGLNYRAGDLADQLAAAAPEGIDVYLDNVGGEHIEAAISAMKDRGRIAWCGGIAQYHSSTPPAAPRNLYEVVGRQLRLEGFLVRDYRHLQTELEGFLVPNLQSGRVVPEETVVHGLSHAVDAFLAMLDGGNFGKMIVQVGTLV